MAKSSIGIYISTGSVDIAELGGPPNAPHLLSFVREKTLAVSPKGAEEDEQERQASYQASLASAIKAGLGKLKKKPTGVYTVLPSSDVMIRYFSMPQLPRSERIQAIGFEARKYVPFKIDDIVSDFKILPSPKQRRTTEVFFIAATKKQLDLHLGIFKKAGTGALGIDIILFALIRLLLLEKKIQPKESVATLYIDNDKSSASIHVIHKGMPFLSRNFTISADDREALFERVASELRVSLGYFRRQNPQAEVSKIIVCGESLFGGLDAFIADELKIITETLERPQIIRGAEKVPPSSIIAIGTALGGVVKSYYSINLSPIAAMIKKRKAANIILAESVAALIIIVATFLFSHLRLGNVSAELNATEKKASALPAYTSDLNTEVLGRLKEKRLDELEFLWLALNNRISWAEKLDRISKDLPEGVWIESLAARNKMIKKKGEYPLKLKRSIHVSGESFSLEVAKELDYINKFFESLKKDPVFMRYFNEIELGSIEKKGVRGYQVTSFKIFANPAERLLEVEGRRWREK